MKPIVKSLIESLYSGRITKEEFFDLYCRNEPIEDPLVINNLKIAIAQRDAEKVEEIVLLMSLGAFKNLASFVPQLCELINLDWHYKHEDIALIFLDIKSLDTVDCLFKALAMEFDYLNYDDTYQFARKCIKALASIGDENAIRKLKLVSESANDVVKSYADKELRNFN